jgi:hypothetical protein
VDNSNWNSGQKGYRINPVFYTIRFYFYYLEFSNNIFARIEELKNTNHVRLMVSTNEIESHIFWSLLKSHEIHTSIFDVRL